MSLRRTLTLAGWAARETLPVWRALRLDSRGIEELALRRLAATLRAAGRAPLQAAHMRRAGLEPGRLSARDAALALLDLPPAGKAELREAGRAALTGGRLRADWPSSLSSGSTGEPFRVYYDLRGWAVAKWLVKLRARAACGVSPVDRVAVLDPGSPTSGPGDAVARRADRPGPVLRLSPLDDPAHLAERLAAFRPHAVYGLPSALLEVARTWLGERTSARPERVFTSGELLGPGLRRALAEAFRCAVLDVYGTSETKEVAWECPAGSLHVNADVLRLEVLDESGRPLPADAEGEIVVTSLVNRAMPLLRYRTGDRGTLRAGRCPCGLDLPLLGIVTGREVDHIQLPGGRRVSPYAFTCGLEPIPGMLRFQVVQIEPARLRVRARVARVARDEAPAAIRSAVLRAADAALSVEVELVDRFDERPGRKFQVVRALSRGDRDGEGRSKEPAG